MRVVKSCRRAQGFTLIEVLIALLVLAIGLLGMASLMVASVQSNQSASVRSQASTLAYDMAERLRLNRDRAVTSTSYETDGTNIPADPNCKTDGCTPAQVATLDLREWLTQLAQVGLSGSITRANNNRYTISVLWQEDSARACGQNSQCSFTLRVDL
ncbi:type IV pilus assembly protein PilV [Metapseudomonas resinovorans]|uniref:type IV pilus modification protein PilV n=1 Tax=Metapseudomonas resinovorans TaxID=53412 RepID=UPI003D234A1B